MEDSERDVGGMGCGIPLLTEYGTDRSASCMDSSMDSRAVRDHEGEGCLKVVLPVLLKFWKIYWKKFDPLSEFKKLICFFFYQWCLIFFRFLQIIIENFKLETLVIPSLPAVNIHWPPGGQWMTLWLFIDPLDGPIDSWGSTSTTLKTPVQNQTCSIHSYADDTTLHFSLFFLVQPFK